ncbi:MAG: hypothetical protein I3273_02810 [Candidatus Moeniiplasma glomeromycotorum]|nr:hypothetical protein [Candidatus Moeniiplasma glomeromycotorum]MCE8167614.1 hypothetical protein [Candidatus Moeniiplasma glomeromycotorum]MCE8169036.1 hypothetical protein [Candidatus Moeniiplasma glomeromycotorum]
MLQGNIKIFQITDKQFKSNGSIEFTLHKPLRYLESREGRIFLANKPPFGEYQVGDFLGIEVDMVRWLASFANSKIWDDKTVVSKVIAKPPQYYQRGNIFSSEEFGDGWVEEPE